MWSFGNDFIKDGGGRKFWLGSNGRHILLIAPLHSGASAVSPKNMPADEIITPRVQSECSDRHPGKKDNLSKERVTLSVARVDKEKMHET